VSGQIFAPIATGGERTDSVARLTARLAPNLADLEPVFQKGEAALRGALGNLQKVDWSNPTKTKQVFAPYLDPVKAAVDAVSKAAAVKPGDISFGLWVGGDTSGGVTGGLLLTIVF